jgi:VanZ family protein
MPSRASSARSLAWIWVALTVYASLHPFAGWQWPPQWDLHALSEVLRLPVPRRAIRFDVIANFLAYIPLGALLALARLRRGAALLPTLLLAVAAGALLSYTVECLQHWLPMRYPSLYDWLLNTGGTALGALLAVLARTVGLLDWWQRRREVWFVPQVATGLSLMLSWPAALLFPPPLPLGLGRGLGQLADLMDEWLIDTPFEGWVPTPDPDSVLAPGSEMLGVALGALAPCFVAFTVVRQPHHRLVLLAGALLLGLSTTTLSTAMNFGPDHAFAWVSRAVLPGVALAAIAGIALAWTPRRMVASLGLVGLTALVALVNQAGSDPYFASSLQGWEQGRFIRFHGLAQWIGWFWPFIALLFLLARITDRKPLPEPVG